MNFLFVTFISKEYEKYVLNLGSTNKNKFVLTNRDLLIKLCKNKIYERYKNGYRYVYYLVFAYIYYATTFGKL